MIKIKKSRYVITIIVSIIAGSLIASGLGYLVLNATGMQIMSSREYKKSTQIVEKYDKLYQLQNAINSEFLWDTDEEQQMDIMYKALVDSLDDKYSEYYTAEEYEKFLNYIQGTFTGVGILYGQNGDNKKEFLIKQVIKDGPAESAGLKQGDVIVKIDGKQYNNMEKVSDKLRGELGSKVEITYRRDGKTRTVSIIRGTIEEPSVGSTVLYEKYGYIRIASFEKGTGKQFENELAKLENQKLDGLIIDLRMNPGGLLDAGISIADQLLPECTITQTIDKNGNKSNYNSDANCTKMDYVVLVDEQSASTSEVLAAAIKDNKGGPLVGTRTFGKGIIQSVAKFRDESAVKLTTMEYLSPNGTKIHKKGVKPDYEVEIKADSAKDAQVEKAIELLKKSH